MFHHGDGVAISLGVEDKGLKRRMGEKAADSKETKAVGRTKAF